MLLSLPKTPAQREAEKAKREAEKAAAIYEQNGNTLPTASADDTRKTNIPVSAAPEDISDTNNHSEAEAANLAVRSSRLDDHTASKSVNGKMGQSVSANEERSLSSSPMDQVGMNASETIRDMSLEQPMSAISRGKKRKVEDSDESQPGKKRKYAGRSMKGKGKNDDGEEEERVLDETKPKFRWHCRYKCSTTFENAASLKSHMLSVHNLHPETTRKAEKSYELCTLCGRKYQVKGNENKACQMLTDNLCSQPRPSEREKWNVIPPQTEQERVDTFGPGSSRLKPSPEVRVPLTKAAREQVQRELEKSRTMVDLTDDDEGRRVTIDLTGGEQKGLPDLISSPNLSEEMMSSAHVSPREVMVPTPAFPQQVDAGPSHQTSGHNGLIRQPVREAHAGSRAPFPPNGLGPSRPQVQQGYQLSQSHGGAFAGFARQPHAQHMAIHGQFQSTFSHQVPIMSTPNNFPPSLPMAAQPWQPQPPQVHHFDQNFGAGFPAAAAAPPQTLFEQEQRFQQFMWEMQAEDAWNGNMDMSFGTAPLGNGSIDGYPGGRMW